MDILQYVLHMPRSSVLASCVKKVRGEALSLCSISQPSVSPKVSF